MPCRTYRTAVRADHAEQRFIILELYDAQASETDLRVIASSLDEAQQLADDHAGVPARDPWMPVYPDTSTWRCLRISRASAAGQIVKRAAF